MVFNSFSFIIFFGLVLAFYYLPAPWSLRKATLVLASYLFYSFWNPPFVLLLLLSTAVDFVLAGRIHRARTRSARRVYLWLSIVLNLGVLFVFKYGGFFIANLNQLAGLLGAAALFEPIEVFLPVGISFYTFQSMSYSIDVYRGEREPHPSPLDFALYVAFFPQLVAGPIVRSDVFLEQCERPPRFRIDRFNLGLLLLLIGLFSKIVLADGLLAPLVERVYDRPTGAVAADVIAATFAFSGQIYFDFSGYSTCAIGLALALGFRLPENFRYPYGATSFAEFWRRWHISLSAWLRDYVYISLGGNRRGRARTYLFILITMGLGGLWHGAGWNFLIWGLLHALFLLVERGLGLRRPVAPVGGGRASLTKDLLRQLGVFLGVTCAWVFFRAATPGDVIELVRSLQFTSGLPGRGRLTEAELGLVALVTIGMLLANRRYRDRDWPAIVAGLPGPARALLVFALLAGLYALAPGSRAFLYFQF